MSWYIYFHISSVYFSYIRINLGDSDLVDVGIPVINKQNYDSALKQGLETFALVRIRIL